MNRPIALALMIMFAGTAASQNALGDGRKNDSSNRQGSGGYNAPSNNDLQQSFALRNAIVTGNAPGGMSFRGNVGYISDRDFRGELGSDTLFSYRRDSLYSGISGLGLRGTDSLQYQFAMTTGSKPPTSIAGSLAVSRNQFMPSFVPGQNQASLQTGINNSAAPISRVDPLIEAEQQAEASGTGLWRLRSASGYVTDKSLSTSYVGSINTGEGGLLDVTASPLEGLKVLGQDDDARVSSESSTQRVNSAANTDGRVETQSPVTSASEGLRLTTGYEQIIEQLRPGYRSGEQVEQPTEDSFTQRIREQNELIKNYIEGLKAQSTLPTSETDPESGEAGETDTTPINDEDLTPTERMYRDLESLNVDSDVIKAMRDNEIMIDSLIANTNPVTRDFFAVHMTQGRDAMRSGNYFRAEERFSMALSIRQGDPTASISRIHSQIGAGLYIAAGTNLRETLTNNPTMITARYSAGLIPPEARLREVTVRLRELAKGEGLTARQSALLLAYVGYHLQDKTLITEGLDRLNEDGGEDRLATLLRVMWLDDEPEADEQDDQGE
ncbi:MAG: hypothetical protein Phyf2KO_25900 [Phycisphaerales bacterium]